jgi:hypothetical protein
VDPVLRRDPPSRAEQGFAGAGPGLRPFPAENSLAVQVPGVSLYAAVTSSSSWVGIGLLVLDSVEVLAVDVGERCAAAGVAEEQLEHRPDE